MTISGFAVTTLILFFLSTIFVIKPLSLHVPLPVIGRTRITIGLMSAPMVTILILWVAQCISATEIRDGIVGIDGIKPYNILILFICLAYMAITLDITGILQAAVFWASNQGGKNGRKLCYYFCVLTTVGVVVGSDPVILSGTAFFLYYTSATGLESMTRLIAEFAAANTASTAFFVGNLTNMVICEGSSFQVNNAAFMAYTILPFIACSLACYAAFAFQFRNVQHIPRTFAVRGKLNPREALRDPVSAIFGGALLLTCLTLVIVLSFFNVDVWEIVLPFAVAKFIFDLSWDHYRFTHGRLDSPKPTADQEDRVFTQLKRALSMPIDIESSLASRLASGSEGIVLRSEQNDTLPVAPKRLNDDNPEGIPADRKGETRLFATQRGKFDSKYAWLAAHFPTFFTALSRFRKFTSEFSSQSHSSRKDWTSSGILQAAALWVRNQGGNNGRKLYFYFDVLLTSVSRVVGNDSGILFLHAMHTILLYSRMPWLENGQRYLVTTFRQFTSWFSSQGHSSHKDWTSSGNRPEDIVDVGGAWKDINWFMENISRAVQNGHNDWRFLKPIVERSDSLWDQFNNMPYRASPFIRKPIEAYRLILLDVNEAIHSHSFISPNIMDEFNVRLQEFEKDLVAIQFEHMRPPDNPSQHQSFHMFKDARNFVISGGNFIQSGPSDRYDRQLAKMMYMHYLTLGVLFG